MTSAPVRVVFPVLAEMIDADGYACEVSTLLNRVV